METINIHRHRLQQLQICRCLPFISLSNVASFGRDGSALVV